MPSLYLAPHSSIPRRYMDEANPSPANLAHVAAFLAERHENRPYARATRATSYSPASHPVAL
jgi:hypothetical protein